MALRNLTILYRGPLSSCNYDCGYCPFAKRRETAAELAFDRRALRRFVDWVDGRGARGDDTADTIRVFFTPWGEALIRSWYREAIVGLTRLRHVPRVAIQTNLTCRLEWVARCDLESLGFWCTFHPSQVSLERFVRNCRTLDRIGARYSVGVVGLREHFEAIEELRNELAAEVYVWINAYKSEPGYYSERELERLEAVDPLFRFNTRRHTSLGKACRCGESVVSVDGDGTVRRCHFIPETIGNLYGRDFERGLRERPCTNASCGCHIGYVHMDELGLYDVFGGGVLERIPENLA